MALPIPTHTGTTASGASLQSPAATTQKRSYTPQEAASLGLGWVDVNNPNYGTAGYVGSEQPATTPASGTPKTGGQAFAPSPQPTLGSNQAPQIPNTPAQPNTGPSFLPPGMGTGATSGTPGAGQTNPLQGAVQQTLLSMMAQSPANVSLTDPTLAPQAAAYKTARTNALQEQRSAAAERASAQGLGDSGALDTDIGGAYEAAGQDIASFNAGLVGQELTARRQQLQDALKIAASLGLAEQANALQRELANLDARLKTQGMGITQEGYNLQRELAGLDTETKRYLADLDAQLRREGYGTQERLAAMDTAVRRYGIDTQGDLGRLDAAIRLMLGQGQLGLGYAGLGQANQQFYDNLGFQIGAKQADIDNAIYNQMFQ